MKNLLRQILVLLAVSTMAKAACISHTGLPGRCRILKKCDPVMKLLKSRPPLHVYDAVRRTLCGFDVDEPKICCPNPVVNGTNQPNKNGNNDDDDDEDDEEPLITPTSVNNHPKLKLLNHEICGPVRVEPRIHGGDTTRVLEYPWMVLLAYKENNGQEDSSYYPNFRCAGSVISRRYVLTAAHCLTDLPDNLTLAFLRVGEHNIAKEIDCEIIDNSTNICAEKYQDVGVEKVLVHPNYSTKNWRNDIALVRLNISLKFGSSGIRPICLPISIKSTSSLAGNYAIATGWGRNGDAYLQPVLQKIRLPLLKLSRCRLAYRSQPFVRLWYRQLCAGGEPGRDTCAGDSGGPLQIFEPYYRGGALRTVQIGIVSFGRSRCAELGAPAVYTYLIYYLSWMLDVMEE